MSKPSSSPATSDQIQEEALAVARSIQRPGQTKEQTRLIAQGIAKGIEQYKRQQAAKSRERDKLRKRFQKERLATQQEDCQDAAGIDIPQHSASRAALWLFGVIFLIMALLHLACLIFGWDISINAWPIPSWISLLATLGFGGLALGSFFIAHRSY